MNEFEESFLHDNKNCLHCVFWKATNLHEPLEWNNDRVRLYQLGSCKRYPPETSLLKEDSIAAHPTTRFHDWCGEFKFNPKAKIGFCAYIPNPENIEYFDYPNDNE